ncbi:MAG TPA: ABC transporter ATP-binding protein [Quisquiliibacterium sp.]|nr:ABC transporter ATP-binding protein [Quisquiliibacterium sp.]HQN12420.1 ABC transporter ATP-binding protein [Quisquiliibacterium sp.]
MSALLRVTGLQAGYGRSQVLFGLDFEVGEGEVVTLLGRNGMGKTTTIKCLTGLLAPSAGRIELAGRMLAGQPAHRIGQAGVGLVPEGRQVFPNLTVRENLVATASMRNAGASPWTLQRVYALFPRLEERQRQLAGGMSGGEQQMLAIGRALMTNPRLLVLDEATEGLAPLIRREIWRCLAMLRREGLAMVVVDKNLGPLMALADRHHIVEKGRIVWRGDGEAMRAEQATVERHLGV